MVVIPGEKAESKGPPGIYILHFDDEVRIPGGSRFGGPWHYVGKTNNLTRRIAQHKSSGGSQLVKAAIAQGTTFRVGGTVKCEDTILNEDAVTLEVEEYCKYCKEVASLPYQIEMDSAPF